MKGNVTRHVTFNKQYFIGMNDEKIKITDQYKVIKKLGKGGYGIVYEIESKLTHDLFACKVISKKKVNDSFETEKKILIQCDYPNIVKISDIFQDPKFYYIVMEECLGGELFDKIIDHIQANKMYSEKEAANLFEQLMRAIAYLHEKKICHRDLKPENLLFATKAPDSPLKLIDFGLSKSYGMDNRMKSKVGTAYYVAPEVLKGNYNEKCDVWSAGTILYILLSGDPPFNGKTDNDIYNKIMKEKFNFPEKRWKNISEEAKDLIKKMLSPQDKRPTAAEVLQHAWFQKVKTEPEKPLEFDLDTFISNVKAPKMKRMVVTFIADRLNEKDIIHLKEKFLAIDKDKNGSISYNELKEGLKEFNLPETELKELFMRADTDKSGAIDYTEFIASCLNVKKDIREAYLQEAFLKLDLDGSGKISREELMTVLKIEEGDEKAECLKKIIDKVDTNKDGEIDYNEFMSMMDIE